MPYYAHSGQLTDRSDWQLLQDHLQAVATLAHALSGASSPDGLALPTPTTVGLRLPMPSFSEG